MDKVDNSTAYAGINLYRYRSLIIIEQLSTGNIASVDSEHNAKGTSLIGGDIPTTFEQLTPEEQFRVVAFMLRY